MNHHSLFRIAVSALLLAGAGAFADESQLSADTAMEIEHVRSVRDEAQAKAKAPLIELDAKYQAAISKMREQAQAAGKSALVEAADASLKELVDSGLADGEAVHPEILKAEKTYMEQRLKLEQQIQPVLVKAEKAYVDQLNRMAAELTKKDEVAEALPVTNQATAAAENLSKVMKAPVQALKKPTVLVPGAMPPSSVLIVKATYGTWDKTVDVTDKVREYVMEMKDFWANPGSLGVDPNPGWNKHLQVVFEKNGKSREHGWGENGSVIYEAFAGPQDSEELAAWLIGTRWRHGREDIVFGIGGAVVKGRVIGEWAADGIHKFSVSWENGDPVLYEFDEKWKEITEKGSKDLVFKRAK